jgi:hypothetical protein
MWGVKKKEKKKKKKKKGTKIKYGGRYTINYSDDYDFMLRL